MIKGEMTIRRNVNLQGYYPYFFSKFVNKIKN